MDSPTRLTSRQCLGPQLGHCWVVKKQTGRGDLGGPGLPHQTPQTTEFSGGQH